VGRLTRSLGMPPMPFGRGMPPLPPGTISPVKYTHTQSKSNLSCRLPATTEWLPARYARHATSALPATDSGHGRLATSGSTIPSSEYAILARLRAAEWWGPDEPATEYDAGYASRYAAGNEWDEAGESVMAASVK